MEITPGIYLYANLTILSFCMFVHDLNYVCILYAFICNNIILQQKPVRWGGGAVKWGVSFRKWFSGWLWATPPQANTCRLLHGAQLLVQCVSIPPRHTHTHTRVLLRKLFYTPLPILTKTNGAEVYVAELHSLFCVCVCVC